MSDQWIWEKDGEQYGPLSTAELERLIRGERIADRDRMRVAGTEDWLPATEIKALFAEALDQSGAETPADAAARIMSQRNRLLLNRDGAGPTGGMRGAHGIGRGIHSVMGFIGACRDGVLAIGERLAGLLAGNGKITLAVILVILLALLFRDANPFARSRDQEIHGQLARAWEELQTLRKRPVAAAEQKRFADLTTSWLAPALVELESRREREMAVSRNQWGANAHFDAADAEWELLKAGKALDEIVQGAATGQGQEGTFLQSLDRAGDILSGEVYHVDYWTVYDPNAPAKSPAQATDESADPWIAGFVVLDLAVVGCALVFWWRRSR